MEKNHLEEQWDEKGRGLRLRSSSEPAEHQDPGYPGPASGGPGAGTSALKRELRCASLHLAGHDQAPAVLQGTSAKPSLHLKKATSSV